jgi:hypothetical protein
MYSQAEILAIVRGILDDAEVQPFTTEEYQLPEDTRSQGVVFMWISPNRKSYQAIQKALNEKGLWIAYCKYFEKLETGSVVGVLIVNDRRKMPRGDEE